MPKRNYSFSNDLFVKLKSHFDIHSFRLNHLPAINAPLLNNATSVLCSRRRKESLLSVTRRGPGWSHCSPIPPGIPDI
ncbi:Bloom syndrome protein -like protein [Caligus rogercresseyi]|uniref:Bloom syndrome protein -like protein n=1 Tax=Caligus rogercresseyi TaxID=217165 RepID=A0A7T8GR59_CALRO|nr:Bloom syndrome protein -like protein [Caligus rogercresseyi]